MKSHKKKTEKHWRAYCYRSGRIEFQPLSAKPPAGVITIGSGPKKLLLDTVSLLARESRPTKPGGKDTYLLVPGIPEAGNDKAAGDALDRFYREVKRRLHPSFPDVRLIPTSERTCVHCGCTDLNACPGGCSWSIIHKATLTGVCSQCLPKEIKLVSTR